MENCERVIEHIISYCKERNFEISLPKLQKLLYFAQGWHLAFYNEPLFDEEFQAWVHGPTIVRLHEKYKQFGHSEILQENCLKIEGEAGKHLDNVLNAYGKRSAMSLGLVTHRDDAWKSTRGSKAPDENCTDVISNELMKLYFKYLRDRKKIIGV